MKTIYFNIRTNQGVETVDEFTQGINQPIKDFRRYVSNMHIEYHLSGQNVYLSSRSTNDWKN